MIYDLVIVIPTLNEANNVKILFDKINSALQGISWEIIFVDDDSPDGTIEVIRNLQVVYNNVRGLQRVGRRGLSSACIEGMMATGARHIAVMDADLQHDETLLPRMYEALRGNDLDIVLASRFLEESTIENFAHQRQRISRMGIRAHAPNHPFAPE